MLFARLREQDLYRIVYREMATIFPDKPSSAIRKRPVDQPTDSTRPLSPAAIRNGHRHECLRRLAQGPSGMPIEQLGDCYGVVFSVNTCAGEYTRAPGYIRATAAS